FETVPANRVNLALWLEADRMRFLNVNRENFENQRSVVKEERRQNVENAPYSLAIRKAMTQPYDPETCFGYSRMGIGSMEDLDAASLEDVRSFYETHYTPNNASLAVVGDFDPDQVRSLVDRYFGGAEPSDLPPEEECEVSYSPGFQADTVQDPNANLPAVVWTFRTPPHDHADTYALTLLAKVVGEGESSRLHRAMVRDAGAATQVVTLYNERIGWRKGPGFVLSYAVANQGVSADSLRALFRREIERLRESPPTAGELEKAKNSYVSDLVMGRQTVMQKAETLQHFALYHDDLSDVNRVRKRFLDVTRDDLERVVDRYLTRENLSVTVDLPASAQAPAGGDSTSGSSTVGEGGDR
ncbi:MAG: M16 family metallopeptidase, partial [Gemmatimonadota bacterium]